jgi:hypothetical protein
MAAYFGILNNVFSSMVYVNLLGHQAWSRLIHSSVEDFLLGRFGKGKLSAAMVVNDGAAPVSNAELERRLIRVIIYASGTFDEVVQTVQKVRTVAPWADITLAVNRDRAPIFNILKTRQLCFDILKDSLAAKIRTAFKVFTGGYTSAITAGEGVFAPYVFLSAIHYSYSPVKSAFFVSEKNLWTIWKVVISLVLGPFSALVTLPAVWSAGKRHVGDTGEANVSLTAQQSATD